MKVMGWRVSEKKEVVAKKKEKAKLMSRQRRETSSIWNRGKLYKHPTFLSFPGIAAICSNANIPGSAARTLTRLLPFSTCHPRFSWSPARDSPLTRSTARGTFYYYYVRCPLPGWEGDIRRLMSNRRAIRRHHSSMCARLALKSVVIAIHK